MTAAIYIRKSREEKDKPSHRLQVQREQLPAHAVAQGWTPVIFDDGHASAARGKTEDLRERGRLETAIRAGSIQIILTIELSRLSRDDSLQDYVAWLHLCSVHKVKLATLTRILDPAQHSDWMLLLMEGGFSSVEMRILQSRMKEGRAQAQRSGKFLGGALPEPYRHGPVKQAPVIDPEALTKMQRLWDLAEEHSARAVALELGLPPIFVRRAIADDRLNFCQALREDPQTGETYPCEWQPCLTSDQVARIKAQRRRGKRGHQRPHAGGLLSALNIFTCGYCGRSIRSWNNHRTRNGHTTYYRYYGCKANETARLCDKSRMVSMEAIDERVTINLLGTLANRDDLHSYWQETNQAIPAGDQLPDLEQRHKQLLLKKQRLTAAIVEGLIDFADAKLARTGIDAELATLKQQQSAAVARQTTEPEWDNLTLTREEWSVLTPEERREIIFSAISSIKMYATYLLVVYRFPRSESGDVTARIHLPIALVPGRKPIDNYCP